MAIVYAHYRKTDNEIFYIGVGKSEKRAYSKHGRNSHWEKVVNKCEYRAEILADGLTWEQACEFEIMLIRFYGRDDMKLGPLVNKTNGGDNWGTETLESRNRRANKIKKPVLQYSKDGDLIKEWPSIVDVEKNSGDTCMKRGNIIASCKGKAHSAYGFVWRYKDPNKWFPPCYDIRESEERRVEGKRKTVLQYNLQGEFLKEWRSTMDVQRSTGIANTGISLCCKGGIPSAGGYLWRYKDEWFPAAYINNYNSKESHEKGSLKTSKPIIQYTLEGEFIQEWPSAVKAANSLGLTKNSIGRCCLGKSNSCGGFVWRFKSLGKWFSPILNEDQYKRSFSLINRNKK